MKRVIFLLAILCGLCGLCAEGLGVIIHVDPTGIDAPEGGAVNDPLATIQYALDAAGVGDTVIIHPGTYTGPGNYNLSPRGKDVHIRSIDPNDAAVVASTIINPAAAGRGFTFVDGESAACILEGLTITGGSEGRGGAVRCDNSSPTIIRCVFIANTATLQGGAIYLRNSNTVIRQSVITGNTANTDGGGIECWYGNITLVNCLISSNTAGGQGGGVDTFNSADVTIVQCTIAENQALSGGGIYLWQSTAAVENCILWNNTAPQKSQIGLHPDSQIAVSWSNVHGGYAGEGNIDSDPLFVGMTGSQAGYYDYHLMSEWGRYDIATGLWVNDAATSPCIDAGNPASDCGDEPWPHGGRVNMGAFGATAQASMNGNPADFNIDGAVDWRDMAELADHWLTESAGIYNLDGVGRVDFNDAAIFMRHWRWQR
ncbi:MAG: hypothetical protein IH624_13210 [Phycisphaerae bacterium]|nr:hypothetical protein [Phycisphaerae bacterium]